MTPDFDAIAAELGLTIGEPTVTAYSLTGEPYAILRDTGPYEEGRSIPSRLTVKSDAEIWADYEREFRAYITQTKHSSRQNVLYWRKRPEVNDAPDGLRTYSRLLVSDLPALSLDAARLRWVDRMRALRGAGLHGEAARQ